MPKQPAGPDGASPRYEPMSRLRRCSLVVAILASVLGVFMIHQSLGTAAPLLPRPPAVADQSSQSAEPSASGVPGTAEPAVPEPPLPAPAAPDPAAPDPAAADPAEPEQPGPALAAPGTRPTRLVIPQISVNAPFTGLDLDAAGGLAPPPSNDTNLVGWYQGGAIPGDPGAAIVLGHVDTKTSPAVFWGLSALAKGNTLDIVRSDGVTATFTVDGTEIFKKDNFPNDRVYKDTPDPQLRLITCGGSYDKGKKDYTSNVVVFAHLTGLRSP
ncbi:class F sortase [Kitasatospora sp. NPDC052896]|uniref:class F sortase n=1 Tax=Kitasatospora sp. NPDC052896 TaxID=3364061 RepID=UPI0037C98A99